MRRLRLLTVLVLAALFGTAAPATDTEPQLHRMVRVFDWANGFPWSYAAAIEQDQRGFLWIAATSGLYRFDGARARRIGPSMAIAPGSTASGRLIVYSRLEGTFEPAEEGLTRLDRDAPSCEAIFLAVASEGTPWRVCDGRLERLSGDGLWGEVPLASATKEDRARLVYPGRNGRVFATSRSKVWSVAPDGANRVVAAIDNTGLVVELASGVVIAGANQAPGPVTTRLFEVRDGEARVIFEERGSRLLSIAERGDTIWIAMDGGLQALGSDYLPRQRLSPPGIPACGNILVDREGSLWMSTSRGVIQLPEPDVSAIAPSGGGVTRDIARTPSGVWGTFWGRLGFHSVTPGLSRWIDAGVHFSTLCRDGAGRVWTSGGSGLILLRADGSMGPHFPNSWNPATCGKGAAGRRWIVSAGQGLWTVHPDDQRPYPVNVAIPDSDGLSFAAEAGDGTLWVATGTRMCAAPAEDVAAGRSVAWRCEVVPGRDVIDFETMPSGDLWAVLWEPQAMLRRAGGKWEAIPGFGRLDVKWINAIYPSPSGGLWIVGQGLVVRVEERPDLPDGWKIVEQPTAWNGLLSLSVAAIEEDADGTLWLATDVGIERIPAAIRRRRADPPPVELVSGSANGTPFADGARVDVPYGRNRLEAHFAALTYRDPSAVRYRMRLHDDEAWSPPGADGHFNFVDLPPGSYDLKVEASLDGERWSSSGGHLAFRVLRPWYANPWVIAGSAIGLALGGHVSYRVKLRRRLARENQRTRIAMDLHDEVGSGLGAISVLAGIAARPGLPDERRGDALDRIGMVSQELARSLGDIVWSLRTSSGYLDALWDQMIERARPLFSTPEPKLTLAAPDTVPHEALSLVVRRNLHLVVYEALHNARRHSGATSVCLRLEEDRSGWRIEIEDDGRGLPADAARPATRRGLGLEAMKARVAEMGGAIAWDRGALGGTRVTVTFRTGEG